MSSRRPISPKSFLRTRAIGIDPPRAMLLKANIVDRSSQAPCWLSTMTKSNAIAARASAERTEPSPTSAPIAGFPSSIRCFAEFTAIITS